MSETAAAGPAAPAPMSAAYRRYALSVLLVIYTLNFLDRQIMSVLAEPIKNDLGLTDTQLGLMTGLAFAVFYTVLGIPIARFAEHANRPLIIATATAVWSAFTVLCGYAQNFVQLVVARIGVGVGEAGCTPPAHSLIVDYTPKEKRASALAFYSLGTPLGGLLGMVLGGLVADAYGWRVAFLVAGAPGVVMALVAAFTLVEPRTKLKAALEAKRAAAPSFGDAMRELRTKRTFWLVAFAGAIKAFIGYGSAAFIVSFFLRNHSAELAEVSASFGLKPLGFVALVLGVVAGVAGAAGTWLGGFLGDRFGGRDLRFNMAMPAIATLVSIPFYVFGLLTESLVVALVVLAIPPILNTLWYGPVYATVQGLVRPETRATAAAILLFIINLIGLGLGPLGIGIISDLLASAFGLGVNDGLRWALIVFYCLGATAFILFWAARRTIREEMVS
ncbi:MAG: MFS transporter [Alphaproteobacteria bacterium]|nr:MFS transporter [Alphaproteobacteria bacterium]